MAPTNDLRRVSRASRVSYFSPSVFSLAICFSFLLATGCGQPVSSSLSEPSHNVDEPVRGHDSWLWADTSDGEFISVVGPLVGVDASDLLPQTHEVTKRTQFWLDQLDSAIRVKYPTELANVPKPRAKVSIDDSVNAFVAPVTVCYKLKVKVRSGTPTAATTVDKVLLDTRNGEFSAWPASLSCLDHSATGLAEIKSAAAAFNAVSPECKFTVTGDDADATLSASDACLRNDDIANVVAAKGVVLLTGANHVTVHTGLFGAFSEESFVAVLAHELAHYYRSHINAHESMYDFFYKLELQATPSRPTPSEDLRPLGEAAVAASTLLTTGETYSVVDGQKLRSELFLAVGSLVEEFCAAGNCSAACKASAALNSDSDTVEDLGFFPFSVDEAAESAYTKFEAKALACLDTVTLDPGLNVLTGSKISWDRIVNIVDKPSWPSWLFQVSAGTLRTVLKMTSLTALRIGESAPDATTNKVKDIILAASKLLKTQDDLSIADLKRAREERVGQYTSEQEADEEAAEWIASLGIESNNVVEAMRRLGIGQETSLGGYLLGEQDCQRLYERNWLDDNGDYFFVPIGDYSEVHHSVCYRMFNLTREIESHHFQVATHPAPQPTGKSWAQLQTMAAEAQAEHVPPGEPLALQASGVDKTSAAARQVMKHSGLSSCVYAPRFY